MTMVLIFNWEKNPMFNSQRVSQEEELEEEEEVYLIFSLDYFRTQWIRLLHFFECQQILVILNEHSLWSKETKQLGYRASCQK